MNLSEPQPGWIEGQAGYPVPFLDAWLKAGHYCDVNAVAAEYEFVLPDTKPTLYNGTLLEIVTLLDAEVLTQKQRMYEGRDHTIGSTEIFA